MDRKEICFVFSPLELFLPPSRSLFPFRSCLRACLREIVRTRGSRNIVTRKMTCSSVLTRESGKRKEIKQKNTYLSVPLCPLFSLYFPDILSPPAVPEEGAGAAGAGCE